MADALHLSIPAQGLPNGDATLQHATYPGMQPYPGVGTYIITFKIKPYIFFFLFNAPNNVQWLLLYVGMDILMKYMQKLIIFAQIFILTVFFLFLVFSLYFNYTQVFFSLILFFFHYFNLKTLFVTCVTSLNI